MRVLLQRVQHASVRVDGAITGSIQQGFLLLVGITPTDTEDIMRKMAGKCAQLRVFEDENGRMNFSPGLLLICVIIVAIICWIKVNAL